MPQKRLFKPRGVTLLELLAAVAVLGIAISAGTSFYLVNKPQRETLEAARKFQSALQVARSTAMARGAVVCVGSTDGLGYDTWVETGVVDFTRNIATEPALASVRFGAARRFTNPSTGFTFAFDPRGFLIADAQRTRASQNFELCTGGCSTGDKSYRIDVNGIGIIVLRAGSNS